MPTLPVNHKKYIIITNLANNSISVILIDECILMVTK